MGDDSENPIIQADTVVVSENAPALEAAVEAAEERAERAEEAAAAIADAAIHQHTEQRVEHIQEELSEWQRTTSNAVAAVQERLSITETQTQEILANLSSMQQTQTEFLARMEAALTPPASPQSPTPEQATADPADVAALPDQAASLAPAARKRFRWI